MRQAVSILLVLIISSFLVVEKGSLNHANALVNSNKPKNLSLETKVKSEEYTPVKSPFTSLYKPHVDEEKKIESQFSKSELDLFARLITAEARNQPYDGLVAVAAVVLNRMKSGIFPTDLEGVIYQKGQFSPVGNRSIYNDALDIAYQAIDDALAGKDPSNGALYFAEMSIAKNKPYPRAQTTTKIGDHTFFK